MPAATSATLQSSVFSAILGVDCIPNLVLGRFCFYFKPVLHTFEYAQHGGSRASKPTISKRCSFDIAVLLGSICGADAYREASWPVWVLLPISYWVGLHYLHCPTHYHAYISDFHGKYSSRWTVLLRSAACTVNDDLDRDFDRHAARCRLLIFCSALGVDLFTVPHLSVLPPCRVASNALWLIMLDYVNTCQDATDEMKAGVRSMAVRYQNTTAFISVLGTAQVSLMVATGVLANLSPVYFIIACGGNAVLLALMAKTVDRRCPDTCACWFLNGSLLIGGATVAGFFSEYLKNLSVVGRRG